MSTILNAEALWLVAAALCFPVSYFVGRKLSSNERGSSEGLRAVAVLVCWWPLVVLALFALQALMAIVSLRLPFVFLAYAAMSVEVSLVVFAVLFALLLGAKKLLRWQLFALFACSWFGFMVLMVADPGGLTTVCLGD